MATEAVKASFPLIILVSLIGFFLIYLIMVSPSERANMLNSKETSTTGIIYIEDQMFVPNEITIKKGDSLTWVNKDAERHRIVGADFASSVLLTNSRYTHKFAESGVYVYSSEFYPGAIGKVIVE